MTKNTAESVAIYGFPRSWGLPNMSPYCMKVEVSLRLAKVPYERKVGDLRRAPRGQMPYALIDGAMIGDSDAIVDRCAADLDAGRSGDQRAKDRALSRMLEESTVWVLRYARFVDAGYEDLRHFMDAILPAGLNVILRPMIRRNMKLALIAQGMGRYSRDEIYAFGRRDIDAVADTLGDRPFIGTRSAKGVLFAGRGPWLDRAWRGVRTGRGVAGAGRRGARRPTTAPPPTAAKPMPPAPERFRPRRSARERPQ